MIRTMNGESLFDVTFHRGMRTSIDHNIHNHNDLIYLNKQQVLPFVQYIFMCLVSLSSSPTHQTQARPVGLLGSGRKLLHIVV
jgi:hypothetical protein